MNIDKMLKFFVPKDHSFYPLFEEDAKNLVKAAELLKELMSTSENHEHERIYKEIKDVEHIGDEITDKTYQALELTANIDDVVDSINGIGRRICLYKPKNLMPVYKEMAAEIYAAALEIQICIHGLNDAAANKNEITRSCDNVKAIEHQADEYYYVAIAELFDKEKDPAELLKNNKILEILERTVDEAEDVTDTIKSILIKMA